MQAIRPRTFVATALADLGGLLLVIGVFLPYVPIGDTDASLWNAYSHVDWVLLILGFAAMLFSAAALITGQRAAFLAAWSVGLFAAGLALLLPIENAFHWGDFGVGFYLVALGPILVVIGSGLGLADADSGP